MPTLTSSVSASTLQLGRLGAGGVHVRDVDRAVVVDVDLGAGRFLDALDRLAARADQQADLLRVDLDVSSRGAVLADLGRAADAACRRMCLRISRRASRACSSVASDDLLVDAVDLEVELDAGDAAAGAGDLEVHVAEVVLVAHDVGQQGERSASLTRPMEMPATGSVIGTPASISDSVPPQTEAMLDGAVRLEDVGDDADRVGELLRRRG